MSGRDDRDSDDMDDLKRLLSENPPPAPKPEARARALAAARTAFVQSEAAAAAEAEKNAASTQGTAQTIRQRDRQTGLMTLIRRRLMNISLPSTRQMMLGGASVAVLALAVIAVQNQDWRQGFGPATTGGEKIGEPANVTPDPARVEDNRDEVTRTDTTSRAPEKPDAPKKVANETGATLADRERAATETPPPPASADTGVTDGMVGGLRKGDLKTESPAVTAEERDADDAPAAGLRAGGNRARAFNGGRAGGEVKRKHLRRAEPRLSKDKPRNIAIGSGAAESKPAAEPVPADGFKETGRDKFPDVEQNQVKLVAKEPVSTFSVDVDTASYSFMRKALNRNLLPAKDSVRIEELINYFPYDYRAPENRETPFSANVTVMDTPWNAGTKLMRIGIKGYEIKAAEKPRSNLVFLIDTSGSMNAADKLPLLIQSFEMLLEGLGEDDTVSIVAYAGSAGTVLEPTRASDKAKIKAALNRLSAGGSTAGGEGIRLAYDLAQASFDKDGVNRVILATDGDFNVGISNSEELKGFIERKRDTGVFLSVLGFGRGNYNDALMQALAQNGNGQAAYIDTIGEARKVLVDEASSTLFPIAKDVKIQVDFNPNIVAEYRLIGYETRKLNREDFNNDKVDAAEIGAGHSVTAIYEITPVGSDARLVDPSRYDKPAADADDKANEYAFVKIRYKEPDADTSKLITRPVTKADEITPDDDARFAAAVAAFGQLLKGGRYTGTFTFDDVIKLANGAKGEDPFNYRGEFVQLVRKAKHARAMERQ